MSAPNKKPVDTKWPVRSNITMGQCQPRSYRSRSTTQVINALCPPDAGTRNDPPDGSSSSPSSSSLSTRYFQYRTEDFIYDLNECSAEKKVEEGFNHAVMKQWDEARKRGVFNYDLKCMYKLLDGDYNLSVQVS